MKMPKAEAISGHSWTFASRFSAAWAKRLRFDESIEIRHTATALRRQSSGWEEVSRQNETQTKGTLWVKHIWSLGRFRVCPKCSSLLGDAWRCLEHHPVAQSFLAPSTIRKTRAINPAPRNENSRTVRCESENFMTNHRINPIRIPKLETKTTSKQDSCIINRCLS